ncbi:GxxExxY protein [Belliella pelovolcani]|uniref:GxxExxY protein n=1 Tax=Belliella pelovolcani TaxID=529505 RepID=A0A1N7MEW2_9BACT|nr:GxxExxY protein [Belliella pelovolcani]SIS84597.1 GxxExxY protein [Belliella pelovolcani]
MIEEDLLTKKVIGAAIEIHKELGPGLLESAYQSCLEYELIKAGLEVKKELFFPIRYKEIVLNQSYRIDLLVENKLVIELKTVEFLSDVHLAQILTYMKFGGFRKGLLLNFNVKMMKDGIKRVIL